MHSPSLSTASGAFLSRSHPPSPGSQRHVFSVSCQRDVIRVRVSRCLRVFRYREILGPSTRYAIAFTVAFHACAVPVMGIVLRMRARHVASVFQTGTEPDSSSTRTTMLLQYKVRASYDALNRIARPALLIPLAGIGAGTDSTS